MYKSSYAHFHSKVKFDLLRNLPIQKQESFQATKDLFPKTELKAFTQKDLV